MSMVERIKILGRDSGHTLASIERELSLGQGSIRKWDGAAPSADKLLKVSELFGVSMEYLLGRTDDPAPPMGERDTSLDDVEFAFYGDYKELDDEDRAMLREFAARLRKLKSIDKPAN
ncbi:transcriptional regulator [Clostridia bacterium]|nr:transcriptional regulator [Clostridia bacterium]